jgi:hypothetical protein
MVKKASTLWVHEEHIQALQALAERLGYVGTRGPAVGQGSASALIRELAEEPRKVAEEIIKLYVGEARQ